MEQKVQRFPIIPLLHTCADSLVISIPHQSGPFVRADESTSAHPRHLDSMVCTGFALSAVEPVGHTSTKTIASHAEWFPCPKDPHAPPLPPSLPL